MDNPVFDRKVELVLTDNDGEMTKGIPVSADMLGLIRSAVLCFCEDDYELLEDPAYKNTMDAISAALEWTAK